MVRQRVDPAIRTRNFKARNERFETGALVKSHKGRNVSADRSGRLLSVESNWTVFKRRLLWSPFSSRRSIGKTDAITDTDLIPGQRAQSSLFHFENADRPDCLVKMTVQEEQVLPD